MDIVETAILFATSAHAGQRRKYTGEAYIWHPLEVARTVMDAGGDDEMIAAAILHDVVEDCGVPEDRIKEMFGSRVAALVMDLTDVSKPTDGNRKVRKQIDLEHTAQAHPDAKTIKLADLISNTKSICQHDKEFAKVYLKEKAEQLNVLREGNQQLYVGAKRSLRDANWVFEEK